MKRYAVVAWEHYYPLSGLRNIVAAFNNHENALKVHDALHASGVYDCVEVVDMQTFDPSTPRDVDDVLMQLGLADDLDA